MAVSSVYDFLSNFRGGGYRPNRYRVILNFPGSVPGAQNAATKISFTCVAASIPSSNMGSVDLPYMGRPVKVPGDKIFDDWSVQILLDNDFLGRGIFERWHDQMLGFRSNVAQPQMVNPINAFASAIVQALDRNETIVREYRVEGMFPTQVGEITLGYDQNDQVAMQAVNFAINGWSSNFTS